MDNRLQQVDYDPFEDEDQGGILPELEASPPVDLQPAPEPVIPEKPKALDPMTVAPSPARMSGVPYELPKQALPGTDKWYVDSGRLAEAPYIPTFDESFGQDNALARGGVQGVRGTIQNAGGAAEVFGILAGDDKDSPFAKIASFLNPAEDPYTYDPYARKVPSLSDIGSAGDLATWTGETFGSGAASTALPVLGGVGGAAAGTAIAGPAGTLIGGLAGAAGPSIVDGIGGTFNDLQQDPGVAQLIKDGKISRNQLATYALVGGSLVGAIDAFGATKLAGAGHGLRDAVTQGIIRTVIKRAASGAAEEGATEAFQEIINQSTQIYAGGNPDLERRFKQVVESAAGGALVGGGFGAAGGAKAAILPGQTAPKQTQHDAANTQTPPGVSEPASEAAGQPTPGGTGTQAPPPANPPTPAESASSVAAPAAAPDAVVTTGPQTRGRRKPKLSVVETVDPGATPSDIQAAMAPPEQTTTEAAAPGPVTEEASAPSATPVEPARSRDQALEESTTDELVAEAPADFDEADLAPAVATEAVTPEPLSIMDEDQQAADDFDVDPDLLGDPDLDDDQVMKALERARQAEVPSIQPANTDEKAALAAINQTEATPEPTPEVTPPSLPQTPTPATPMPETLGTPEAAWRRQAPPTVAPAEEPSPVAAAVAQPIAPAAAIPETAASVGEEPLNQTPLVASPVSRMLADETRVNLQADPDIAQHPLFEQTIDQVSREMTQSLPKGTAPAAAVRQRSKAAVDAVRQRLTQADQQAQEADATVEAQRLAQSAQTQQQARTEGAPQERARTGKVRGKSTDEILAESDLTMTRRAQRNAELPEDQQDTDLKEWRRLQEARGTQKGRGAERAKVREKITKAMDERKRSYAERTGYKPEPKPALAPKPRPEPVAQTEAQKAELDNATDRETEAQRQAKARERSTAKETTHKAAVADLPSEPRSPNQLRAGLQKASQTLRTGNAPLSTKISPENTPSENMLIYAARAAQGKVDLADYQTARWLYDNGQISDFNQMISENLRPDSSGKGGNLSYDESKLHEDHDVDNEARFITSAMEFDEGPQKFNLETADGQPVTLTTRFHTSASKALDRAVKMSRVPGNRFGVVRKALAKQLKKLVGDVPVVFITAADMKTFAGKDAAGLHLQPGALMMQQGERPVILINAEHYRTSGPMAQSHVLIHEIAHAATVFAMHTNYRGTNDIVKRMMSTLKMQMVADGLETQDYGLTSPAEFIAEAYSNPAFQDLLRGYQLPSSIVKSIGVSDRAVSWWDAFVSMVQNAMGMLPFGRLGHNYLEGVMRLAPDVNMSSEEQVRRANEDFIGDLPINPEYGARDTTPRYLYDALPIMNDADERVEASRQAKSRAWLGERGRALAARVATTEELKRRAARFYEGSLENVFSRYADVLLKRDAAVARMREDGQRIIARLSEFTAKNKQMGEQLADVMFGATLNEIDPSVPLSHENNKHISKAGDRHAPRRTQHGKLAADYMKLSPEAKKLFHEINSFYKGQQDKRVRMVVRNIIDEAIKKNRVVLPQGVTKNQLAEWVVDGSIDRAEEDQTARDKILHEALGNVGKALKGSREMRLVRGTYVPLTRQGKYYFTARQKIPTPDGATREQGTEDHTTFVFDDKKKVRQYLKSTEDQVTSYFTRSFDPVTGEKVNSKEPNAVTKYYVRVMDRSMEMADNVAELEALRKQYEKDGHTTSAVDELIKDGGPSTALLPDHVNRLINNVNQNGGSDNAKASAKAAITDAYFRTLAGSRAQHRQLKRAGVKGFSRDLVRAMDTTNSAMANHLANLDLLPEQSDAAQAIEDDINAHRYGDKQNVLEKRAIKKELDARAQTHGYREVSSRVSNFAMGLSFVKHLFSPAYSIVNAMQPLATTGPVLGAKFGNISAARAMMGAAREMGAIANLTTGVKESAREFGHYTKNISKVLWGSYTNPRGDTVSYHKRMMNILNSNREIKNRELKKRVVQRLADLGFGTDNGLDLPSISDLKKNRAEIALDRTVRVARMMPEAVESVNRYLTALAAVDLAKAEGKMTDQQILDYAVTTVEQTQGGYATANNPNFMASPIGRVVTQFKKYGLMYGQLYYGALGQAFNYGNLSTPESRQDARRLLINLTTASTLMAGVAGYPLMEIARVGVMLLHGLGLMDDDWDDEEVEMEKLARRMFDVFLSEEQSDKAAEVMMHGASRAVGVDLSAKLGNDSLVFFGQPRKNETADIKAWLFDMLGGATVGMVYDAGSAVATGDWSKLPFPKVISDAMKAQKMITEGVTTKAGRQIAEPSTIGQGVVKGLGFTPAASARRFEAGGDSQLYKQSQKLKEKRSELFAGWRNAENRVVFFRDYIEPFNRGKTGKDRITQGDLLKNLKRFNTDSKRQREKTESQKAADRAAR